MCSPSASVAGIAAIIAAIDIRIVFPRFFDGLPAVSKFTEDDHIIREETTPLFVNFMFTSTLRVPVYNILFHRRSSWTGWTEQDYLSDGVYLRFKSG